MKRFALIAIANAAIAVAVAIAACGSDKSKDSATNEFTAVCGAWSSPSSSSVASGVSGDASATACTWTKMPAAKGFGQAGDPQPLALWASSPTDVFVGTKNFDGWGAALAHFDGVTWTDETPPEETIPGTMSLWGTGPDDVWAATASPTLVLLHRTRGAWQTVTTPITALVDSPLVTTGANGDILIVGSNVRGSIDSWRKCGDAWAEVPLANGVSDPAEAGRPPAFLAAGLFKPDATHVIAFGGGFTAGATTHPQITAAIQVFEGTSWRSITMPALLTDIVSIGGSSFDDLYISALDRNQDGVSRLYHVTDGLKNWPIVDSPTTLRVAGVTPTIAGSVFVLGCDWVDQTQPAPSDCGRIARATVHSIEGISTIGPDLGAPFPLFADPISHDLYAMVAESVPQSPASDGGVMNGLLTVGLYRARCE